ncbi:hypothetical protein THIOKS11490015 [Thiocapsa sp. KS1]|nr:hypothetical protein [Thiocapsa sp. KS1]CRI63736.1 hypothetical protein THIOKS11490015 [Thiocapsa sp. KS1]
MKTIPNTNPQLVILAVEANFGDDEIVTRELPIVAWLVDEEVLRAPDAIPVSIARVPLRWAILDRDTGMAYGTPNWFAARAYAVEHLADLARADAARDAAAA